MKKNFLFTFVIDLKALGTEKLTVYPNPTTGIVNFNRKTGFQILTYSNEIINKEARPQVDLTNYPAGIYLVKTEGDFTKIVKQ